jgi:hypothetical protein
VIAICDRFPLEGSGDMSASKVVAKVGQIHGRILLIRGAKIILDADLAEVYGVPTRRLNEQVKRNKERFPEDFMFQLSAEEKAEVIANCDHLDKLKFSKALPLAFTEHGAIMAASVLNSPKAVEISVFVVRAFVQLREVISGHSELAHKIAQLERKLSDHDEQILVLVEAIKQLMDPKLPPKTRRIGFHDDSLQRSHRRRQRIAALGVPGPRSVGILVPCFIVHNSPAILPAFRRRTRFGDRPWQRFGASGTRR